MIEIIRRGRAVTVEPFPDYLRQPLTFAVRDMDFNYRGSISVSSHREEYFAEDETRPGRFVVPAGFTFRICQALQEHGVAPDQIHYHDIRQLNIEAPQLDRLDECHDWQLEALSHIFSSDGGIVHCATASGKSWLIKQLCRILPHTRIVITGHVSEVLRDIYRELRPILGPDEITAYGTVGKGHAEARITVCHIRSLLQVPLEKVQLCIYDEVHGAAAEQRAEYLALIPSANLLGFTASLGRTDAKDPVIEGLFGPVIYRKLHEQARDEGLVCPIVVHIYRITGPAMSGDVWLDRMYIGYIRNNLRNERIAMAVRKYNGLSTIVLAQNNLEHLFRLHRYLPDFVPVYAGGGFSNARWNKLKKAGLIPEDYRRLYTGEESRIADQFRNGEINQAICTSVWKEGVDFPNLQVLVRADGMPGEIDAVQIPGRVARWGDENKEAGIIVDFIDDFGDTFKKRSEQRLAHYRALGYPIEMKEL